MKKLSRAGFAYILLFSARFSRSHMVEAAGIEPASESIRHQVTTCLSSSTFSPPGVRRGRTPRDQPRRCFAPRPLGETGSLSRLVGAPETLRERASRTACLSIRPRLLKVLQLIFSACLTRLAGPRHATCVSLPPSNPVRPHTPFVSIIESSERGVNHTEIHRAPIPSS